MKTEQVVCHLGRFDYNKKKWWTKAETEDDIISMIQFHAIFKVASLAKTIPPCDQQKQVKSVLNQILTESH